MHRQDLCYREQRSVHQHAASALRLVKEGETHVLQVTQRANHYKIAQMPAKIWCYRKPSMFAACNYMHTTQKTALFGVPSAVYVQPHYCECFI